MKGFSIKAKLLTMIAIMGMLLVAVLSMSVHMENKSLSLAEGMYKDFFVPSVLAMDCLVHGRAIQGNLLRLYLTSDPAKAEQLVSDISRRAKQVDENISAWEATVLTDYEKEHLPKAKELLKAYRAILLEALDLAKAGRGEEARGIFEQRGFQAFEGYQKEMRGLANYLREEAARRNEDNRRYSQRALWIVGVVSVSLSVLVLAAAVFVSLSIARRLASMEKGVKAFAEGDLSVVFDDHGSDEVASMGRSLNEMTLSLSRSMEDIRAVADSLSKEGQDFAAVSEETIAAAQESKANVDEVSRQMDSLSAAAAEISSSVEEVSSGSQMSAQRSTEIAERVERARALGEDGASAVALVTQRIGNVAEASGTMAGEVRRLVDSAREIQSFVAEISGIADQTNLLALNAAIEAARAGEHGRGFAVVAEEVRKLAEESNEAARKISDLANTITQELKRVVESSDADSRLSQEASSLAMEAKGTIEGIISVLAEIASATQDLAAVSEEQAASSAEISSAVRDIASEVSSVASSSDVVRDQMSQVAKAAERVAEGAEDMVRLASDLLGMISRFKTHHEQLLADGGQTGSYLPPPRG
ncbi:methyl-accepting chemotaxis protein [Thermanaerovibrio velox DSM 12556]|uniref:Methyl-accepting chemotaxis protein n=1 Tax=Thermanaerovibrio velox DSM 12556 TaxID=926567 RepID=H0UN85_9BACT|nr:methyl-accepting chemotaxis protein [Thermanaerovibrio velox]EHM10370.1 methyl-accepting chemotaxis protein [Thermanaerovibrio velox DSM 12556]